MKYIATVIILFVIIRLSSYGVWNLKKEKNIIGAIGVGLLDIAIIFCLASFLMKLTM